MHRRFIYSVILALAIAAPFILSNPHQRELLVLTCIFGIAALSWDIIMGYMGQFSFGHQAYFGIGAYASAILTLRLGVSVWLGFLGAIVFAAAAGFLIGYVALRSTRAFALAMITLGFGMVLWLIGCGWQDFTGGLQGLWGLPSPTIAVPLLPKIELRSTLSYYYLVLPLLLLTIYFISRFLRSRFGRALISLRENEDLASSIGVSAFRYFLLTFTLATGLAGLSGALYVHHLHIVNPMLLGLYYMFMMMVMVLVGGTGTLWGPVIGAAIFVWVPEYVPLGVEYRFLLFGIVLLVVIIFLPQGIYPSLVSLWNRFIVPRAWAQKKR